MFLSVMFLRRLAKVTAAPLACIALLSGCAGPVGRVPVSSSSLGLSGQVHGGQQPVAGASLQLYAAGSAGDGSAATPLLTQPVLTDSGGNFNITGLYTCPAGALVYLTATGGNPGTGGNNANLALTTALGDCSALGPGTTISVNEITTVAAVSALAPFMSSLSAVGSSSADANALAQAFTLAAQLADPTTGLTPGLSVPGGMSVPSVKINTLANILAACVNTNGGAAGTQTPCGSLFSLTAAGAATPADTIAALLNVQRNPTLNTAALLNLTAANSPFQPQFAAAPADFAVALTASPLLLSSSSLTFSTTPLGSATAAQNIVLTNILNSAVTLLGIGYSGPGAADFVQTNNCPAALAKAASCIVQSAFVPSTAGIRTAALVINAYNASSSIAVSGTAVQASTGPATLSASSLTFYEKSSSQTLTLTNSGAAPLAIQSIGVASADFSQTNTCGAFLSGLSTCTITVTSPTAAGLFSDALTVTDSAGTQRATLTANQNYSQVYTISNIAVGTQSSTFFSKYGGVFDGSLQGYTFGRYSGTLSGPAAQDFVGQPGLCTAKNYGNTVPVCQIAYYFQPTATGVRYAILSTNAGEVFLLKGTAGTTAGLSLSPSSYDFGSNATGSTTTTRFVATNNSTLTVSIYNVGLATATGSSDYRYTTTCSFTFAPGSTCFVDVTFTPRATGTRSTTLILADQNGNPLLSAAITGQGGVALPAAVNFGNVAVGGTATQTVTATVPGKNAVTAQISTPTSGGSSVFNLPGSFYCAAGAPTCQFTLTFTPPAVGSYSGQLAVTDTVTGAVSTSVLSGSGGVPVVSLSASSLQFGVRTPGTTSLPQTVIVTNTGNAPLVVSSIAIGGSSAADFAQTSTCTAQPIAPSGSCTVAVTDTPTGNAPASANLIIVSNAPAVQIALTSSGS